MLLLGVAIGLSACGGNRAADPIAVVQPTDQALTCAEITAQYDANELQIARLRAELDEAHDQRVMHTIFGGLIGYATSEDGTAAKLESNALTQRNVQLRTLARSKNCQI